MVFVEKGRKVTYPGMFFRIKPSALLSFIDVDEGAPLVTGYSKGELVDTGLVMLPDLVSPDDRERFRSIMQEALEKEKVFVIRFLMSLKNGLKSDAIIVGHGIFKNPLTLTGIEGYIIKITDNDGTAVYSSNEAHVKMLAHASDLILMFDAAGNIRYSTPVLTRILGYPAGRLEGTEISGIIDETSHDIFSKLEKVCITDKRKDGISSEIRMKKIDGTSVLMKITLFAESELGDDYDGSMILIGEEKKISFDFDISPIPMIITSGIIATILKNNCEFKLLTMGENVFEGKNITEVGLIPVSVIETVIKTVQATDKYGPTKIYNEIFGKKCEIILSAKMVDAVDLKILWAFQILFESEEIAISDLTDSS